MKKKNKEIFLKLSKEEKENLTISWLCDFILSNHLSLDDAIEIFNAFYGDCDIEKWKNLANDESFNICTIARLFGYGYPKSKKIVEDLVKQKIIEKSDKSYKILSKENFLIYGQNLFKQKEESYEKHFKI